MKEWTKERQLELPNTGPEIFLNHIYREIDSKITVKNVIKSCVTSGS